MESCMEEGMELSLSYGWLWLEVVSIKVSDNV
jgi:hypothetical protein